MVAFTELLGHLNVVARVFKVISGQVNSGTDILTDRIRSLNKIKVCRLYQDANRMKINAPAFI